MESKRKYWKEEEGKRKHLPKREKGRRGREIDVSRVKGNVLSDGSSTIVRTNDEPNMYLSRDMQMRNQR